MNRVLELLREQLGRPQDASDRQLLDRFRDERDEVAFAELVRRYAPVVWGVCRRRLANTHDAEDAFQATFLVLVRRADRIDSDVPLGPWLHRVAVMTTRNVARGNRRRAAVSGPMEHDVAERSNGFAEKFDLDAALLALPERYRAAVVLCHLQGLTRREAATLLGCPEGTLSARLSRALARLRARLGVGFPAILAAAGTTAAPAVLSAATVRAAAIYTTSTLTAAGVSPVVAGLTDGVLRMFWMKKLTAGMMLAVLVAGGLFAGLSTQSGSVALATVPLANEPQSPPDDPEATAKKLEKQLADLQKQKELINAMMADLTVEQAKLEEAKRKRDELTALGTNLGVVINHHEEGASTPPYTVHEVSGGKIREVHCSDSEALALYLRRTFNDSNGPKGLRVSATEGFSTREQVRRVFEVCAAAGYKKASFTSNTLGFTRRYDEYNAVNRAVATRVLLATRETESPKSKTTEIDLTGINAIDLSKYNPKKP